MATYVKGLAEPWPRPRGGTASRPAPGTDMYTFPYPISGRQCSGRRDFRIFAVVPPADRQPRRQDACVM